MRTIGKAAFIIAALMFAGISLFSQTSQSPKPSFEVISIKPSAPNPGGARGGGARGNRYTMSAATLRTLLQSAYQRISPGTPASQLQIVGGPNWIDSDRYDIQATVDCGGGVLSRDQVQLMVQSMLEDRFQLKAHMETRELPVYDLVVGKDGSKIKASADQTPQALSAGGPPQPCGPAPAPPSGQPPTPPLNPSSPNFVMPRGGMMVMSNPTGITTQGTAVPLATLINTLQQTVGRPVIDKTDLKGLFDYKLQFSHEGLAAGPSSASAAVSAGTTTAPDPIPSIFTAIQDLGLRLESSKGPLQVLVIDSVQKPKEN
jgi:uncharacterized protein (TIGR03435 family)